MISDPAVTATFTDAQTAFAARDAAAREADQKSAARSADPHCSSSPPASSRSPPEPTSRSRPPSARCATSARRSATVPPLPSKQDHDEVVQRLKAAQTALTPKVQELREVADWQRWANVGIQEQLCEKMEALRRVEDPEEIAAQVRDLQQQWRQAADVPRAQGEALWRRFKAAHDEAWARCEAHFAAQAEARAENLAKKIALCERAEALADSTNWIQTADEIKKLQAEWKTIGPVTRGQEKAIWERFRAACDRFFTRRHADLAERKTVWAENLAKKEALCAQVEALAESTDWERDGRRNQAAAGRVEDDRAGEEEPLGSDLAAVPRRVRPFLRPLRAAARHRARRARRRARGDLRRARGAGSVGPSRQSESRPQSGRRQPDAAEPVRRSRTGPSESVRPIRRSRCDGACALEAAGSRKSPRAASIAIARSRSTSASRRRSARVLARWPAVVRRHRSRSRREPPQDGSARPAHRGRWPSRSRGSARRPATPRCRRPTGWRRC